MIMNKESISGTGLLARIEFGGRGVRHLRLRDRSELENFTRSAGQVAGFDKLDALVRDADAMSPARLVELQDRMARLQHEWESLAADERVCVSEWVESICRPWIEARVPLRGNGLEPSWATDLLLTLLIDFDSSGQVIETVDAAWERPARASGNVSTTARLAVAAAWISWSHLIVDPGLSQAALTMLGDLLDRLETLSHDESGTRFETADRAWTRAAITLESRLLRHWQHGAGPVH